MNDHYLNENDQNLVHMHKLLCNYVNAFIAEINFLKRERLFIINIIYNIR